MPPVETAKCKYFHFYRWDIPFLRVTYLTNHNFICAQMKITVMKLYNFVWNVRSLFMDPNIVLFTPNMAFHENVMVENKVVYFVKIKNNRSNFISIGGHTEINVIISKITLHWALLTGKIKNDVYVGSTTRDQNTLSITNVKVVHHKFADLIECYKIHINFIFSPDHVKKLRFFEDVLRSPLSCYIKILRFEMEDLKFRCLSWWIAIYVYSIDAWHANIFFCL